MVRAGHLALVLMFVLVGGILLLYAGEHPFGVVLMLGGTVLFMVRTNAIVDRGRLRLGKPEELVGNPLDILALNRRDWAELLLTNAVAAGMFVGGLLAF